MTAPKRKVRAAASEKIVREPSSRTFITWTAQQIKAAEVQADGGSLRLAADLCERILGDDHIQGVLTARTRGLLRLPVEFEAAGDKRRSGKAIKALEAGEDFWAAYPESELGPLLDWGALLGVGLGQNIPTLRDNGRVIPKLSRYHERWLQYDWSTRSWRVTTEDAGEVTAVAGDGRWIIHTPYGEHRPWVNGAWRCLARWWLLKELAREDYAHHSEAHGNPAWVATSEVPSTKELRQELANDLANLGRDTGIAMPPGFKVGIVEATARTWQMFRDQMELANLGITIRLAGQNLTTNVSGGSLAAARVHLIIRNDLIASDAEAISTTLHDQSLVLWSEWNFGDRNIAPWPCWPTDPPEDELAGAQAREAQGKAIVALKAAGVKLDPVLEEFGLELDPNAAPPPVAPPVGAAPQDNVPPTDTGTAD
jgi:hypothetical protein